MFTALLSFLGGNVFRMLWGELSAWLSAKQDHSNEMERMRFQAEIDEAAHRRRQEAIKLQADMKVEVIRIQSEADITAKDLDAFIEGVKLTGQKSGMLWVDAWNAVIRPALATWSVAMITGHYMHWWALDENGWALTGAALGIYVADRSLFKRGK